MPRRTSPYRRPGSVSLRDRFRRLPNSILLYVTFVLAVGSGVLATLPFDAPATAEVPLGEAQLLEAAAATSSVLSVSTASTVPDDEPAGSTTTTYLLGLEVSPRVTDGHVECGPPLFELTVPGRDDRVARNDDCARSAGSRVLLASVGGGLAFLVGMTARRMRLRRYEAIKREERRRMLRRRDAAARRTGASEGSDRPGRS